MKRYIPNALTLLNLFSGCIAVVFACKGHFVIAAFFVFTGIFFDFFDGFAARKLKVQSELGVHLDSLADMVTSGVVPGIIMFRLLGMAEFEWGDVYFSCINKTLSVLSLIGFSITLASAYRLAKFNIDIEQQNYFKGLPTPANTLLIVSLPLIIEFQDNDLINAIILNGWFLIWLSLFSCWILNSEIKLFALKFKHWNFKDNGTRYIFIILCIVLLIVLQFIAIPTIIFLYIIMSVLNNKTLK